MNPLLSLLSRYMMPRSDKSFKRAPRSSAGSCTRQRTRLCLEPLEERSLLSVAVSIGDASAIEGASKLKVIDRFVPEGSGGLARPRISIFGPDGKLYVVSTDTNAVLRYDGASGSFLDTFVTSGSGGLNNPCDLAFGPDGNLYVSSFVGNQVLRYDGSSGAFLDVVASGLSSPVGITFGGDGSLYIANQGTNEVLRKDGSGLTAFVSAGSGGLIQPRKAVFGSDGNLYVASLGNGLGNGQVLRYDGLTGAFLSTFTTTNFGLQGPAWLGFGTDGYLYTTFDNPSSHYDITMIRFNAATGAFGDSIFLGQRGWSFTIASGNIVYDTGNGNGNFVDRIGPSSVTPFTVSLDSASPTPVTVNYSTADGTAVAGTNYTAASGTLTFTPGLTAQTILVQTLDDGVANPNKNFTITLSSPVGATIARGQGTGSINEGDATKFYVADDGGTDRTYRYGISGNAFTNSTLGSGDTAPRGVASNAAGNTVWVADANKTVYVYSPSGGLLGSWSAGGLSGAAQVEGVATNGTDIWILDNKADKVVKYTGAASRLSGSQNAASSFNLNSGNSNGKGIVTDGTSLWVVDDGSSTDKVFKYTLTGGLLGSWAIDSLNTHPTGLTINPANVSDIWIVDNGTLKVYQYTAAAGRTSGSQGADALFALATGNSNPQDIADPPPADTLLTPAAAPLALNQPAAALSALSSLGPSALSSLSSRDAVFALLVPHPDRPTPIEDRGEAHGTSGPQNALVPLTSLAPGCRPAFHPSSSAARWLAGNSADEDSPATATDSFFAGLADDRHGG